MSTDIAQAAEIPLLSTTKLLGWNDTTLGHVLLDALVALTGGHPVLELDATGSTAETVLAAQTPAGDGQWAVVSNWPGQATTTWRARKIADGSLVWAQIT